MDYTVTRYVDDSISVGDVNLGQFRDLVQAEYIRAGLAFNMRAMWYSGSPYGKEILELAKQVR